MKSVAWTAETKAADPAPCWWVYMLCCDGQALYTGISTDVQRRLTQHARGLGARSLRRYHTLKIVYTVAIGSRSHALRVESRIKRLSAAAKRELLRDQPDTLHLLARLQLDLEGIGPGANDS